MTTQHIEVGERTKFQDNSRAIWIHACDGGEFSLHFTGGGSGLEVDLPVSVIPALVAALEKVRLESEARVQFEAAAEGYVAAIQGEGKETT